MNEERSPLPIWFFIGLLLLVYGVLLLCSGIWQFSHPPQTVLPQYHATFWGGVILTLVGGLYVVLYRPARQRRKLNEAASAASEKMAHR